VPSGWRLNEDGGYYNLGDPSVELRWNSTTREWVRMPRRRPARPAPVDTPPQPVAPSEVVQRYVSTSSVGSGTFAYDAFNYPQAIPSQPSDFVPPTPEEIARADRQQRDAREALERLQQVTFNRPPRQPRLEEEPYVDWSSQPRTTWMDRAARRSREEESAGRLMEFIINGQKSLVGLEPGSNSLNITVRTQRGSYMRKVIRIMVHATASGWAVFVMKRLHANYREFSHGLQFQNREIIDGRGRMCGEESIIAERKE